MREEKLVFLVVFGDIGMGVNWYVGIDPSNGILSSIKTLSSNKLSTC